MKYAIIGAGFTGLAAAQALVSAGHSVTVFEAAPHAGGLAAGFKEPGWDWYLEKYYHHWFNSDTEVKQLLGETGLISNLLFFKPKTAVFYRSQFYPLDSPQSILNFPGFNLSDKVRFAAVTAYLKYVSSWEDLEKYTAVSWLKKHYGLKLYHLIWDSLLQGKFGPHYQSVTMAWMWARLKARTPNLGTYRGGFQACLNDLVAYLQRQKVEFHFSSPVNTVSSFRAGVKLTSAHQTFIADKVLLTTPPNLTQKIVPSLPPAYLASILKQPYLSAVMVIFSLKNPLSTEGVYWHNLPKSQGFPFLSLVEHTHFVSPEHFGGRHLIYCGDYVTPDHPYLTKTQKALVTAFLPGLKLVNPRFKPDWIEKTFVFKTDYAQPVPHPHQSKLIPSIQSPLKHIFLANMAQVYPWDRGTNFAIEIGRRAAQIMLSA